MTTKDLHGLRYSFGYRYRRNYFVSASLQYFRQSKFLDCISYNIDMYSKPVKLYSSVRISDSMNIHHLRLEAYG